MKLFNIKRLLSHKGFTLIELLVVIAVLGVLSAAIVAAINPLTKINQATDSNTKNNIAQVAGALQAYYTSQATPAYPSTMAQLVSAGELKALPPTAGWAYSTSASGVGAALSASLKITTATETVWCWKSDGTAPVATTACTAP